MELYCLHFPFFSTLYVILFLIFFSVFANEKQRIQSGKLVTCYFKKEVLMWKKRACSVLLALMVAMTATPFSAVPVYSQEAETMQDASDTGEIGEEEVLTQKPAQAAEEAVEEETDTEDVSASDAQSQEEEKEQEEALSSDEAAAEETASEDDETASEAGQETDGYAEA